jgi:hypothetical protein
VSHAAPALADSQEFFYIALSVLEMNEETNLIPEFLQVLSPRQLIVLSQVFGGRSLKIPTSRELSNALKAALYLYYAEVERRPVASIREELELTDKEFEGMLERADAWKAKIKAEPGGGYYGMMTPP